MRSWCKENGIATSRKVSLCISSISKAVLVMKTEPSISPQDLAAAISRGQASFTGSNRCANCHQAGGGGGPRGPDLTDAKWLHCHDRGDQEGDSGRRTAKQTEELGVSVHAPHNESRGQRRRTHRPSHLRPQPQPVVNKPRRPPAALNATRMSLPWQGQRPVDPSAPRLPIPRIVTQEPTASKWREMTRQVLRICMLRNSPTGDMP